MGESSGQRTVLTSVDRPIDLQVSARCIAGHFPHRPLVPGALLCGAAAMAMEAQLEVATVEVAKLRFSAPVQPGVGLSLHAVPRSASRWRVQLVADGREVLRGQFGFAADADAASAPAPADFDLDGDPAAGAAANVEVLTLYAALPHAGSMRLLEDVRAWDSATLLALSRNHRREDHPLRLDGRLHGLAALEYAAQACALHAVLTGGLEEGGGTTVVATVQELQFRGGDLDRSGAELWTQVRCVLRQRQAAAYQCRVTDGLGWHLQATLGLMRTPE